MKEEPFVKNEDSTPKTTMHSKKKGSLGFDLANRFCYDWANSNLPQ